MSDNLKKAFNLAKKTGDRVIVVDDSSESDAFVVMNIDEYEKILSYKESYSRDIKGLTEDELIDKINRDIALWKNEQQDEEAEEMDFPPEEEIEEENMYYYAEPEWNFLSHSPLEEEDDEEEGEEGEEEGGKAEEESKDDETTAKKEEKEENIFEKFNREQKEYSRSENNEGSSKNWNGKNDWKIPFDVKAGADEVKE